MKTINVIIERSKDGLFTAVPQHDYPVGFFGTGNTVEEAMADLHKSQVEAKELYPELPDFLYKLHYDVPSFLQLFGRKLSLAGLQAITGINRKQLNHYVTGHSKPSPATVKKIEQGIRSFQQELSRVVFVY